MTAAIALIVLGYVGAMTLILCMLAAAKRGDRRMPGRARKPVERDWRRRDAALAGCRHLHPEVVVTRRRALCAAPGPWAAPGGRSPVRRGAAQSDVACTPETTQSRRR